MWRGRMYPVAKRWFDVAVALTVLGLTWPIWVTTAIAIRVTMGSPVLFCQERPGQGGALFSVVKFRTMRSGTGSDAERMTKLGRFLRSASIDELPQLFNVLRGEMSLVGPRPLLPEYLPLFDARQATRQRVLPGVTGLAQVSGRNDLPWSERLELDACYAESCSFGLDLRILWRTVRKTAAQDGIRAQGEATVAKFTGAAPAEQRSVA